MPASKKPMSTLGEKPTSPTKSKPNTRTRLSLIGQIAVEEHEAWAERNQDRRALWLWLKRYQDQSGEWFTPESATPPDRLHYQQLKDKADASKQRVITVRSRLRRAIVNELRRR